MTHDDVRPGDDPRYGRRDGNVPGPRQPRYDQPSPAQARGGPDWYDDRSAPPGSGYLAGPDGPARRGGLNDPGRYGPAGGAPVDRGRPAYGADGRPSYNPPPGRAQGAPGPRYGGPAGAGGGDDYDGDPAAGLYGGGYGGEPGSAAEARRALQGDPLLVGGGQGPGGPRGPGGRGPGGPGGGGPGGPAGPGATGPGKKRRPRLRTALKIGGLALAVLILLGIGTVGLIYVRTEVPDPNALPTNQIATIYYGDGKNVLARVGSQNRSDVKLAQIPEPVRFAVLAAENRSFYTDPGISPTGITRAALNNLKGGDLQGGSTITQQYVKNAFTNGDRTFQRKFKELFVTVKLDKQYSKNQILEWYLNTIYFGRGAYGIQAASQVYFGKPVTKLSVAEGAVLASSIRSPALYDPQAHPVAAKARWQFVLDGMVTMGKLTPADEAKQKYPKVRKKTSSTLDDVKKTWAGHVEDQVLDELDAAGFSQARLNQEGLRVVTTISKRAQDAALNAVKEEFADQKSPDPKKQLRQALVAVEPQTGKVLAYYGGSNGLGQDYAQSWRQAGSAFKPYVLATALTQSLDPETPDDKKISVYKNYDGSSPQDFAGTTVANSEGAQCNPCSVLDAMRRSINTVFYQMGIDAGPSNVAALAHKLGIPPKRDNGAPTLQEKNGGTAAGISIGQYEVRTIDQAQGFGVFATGGTLHPAHFVDKVIDSGGKVVYSHEDEAKQVLDSKVANDVTYAMKPVAAASLDPLDDGRDSAAKTGTQQYLDTGGNSDAWMVGFTPKVSAAVWVGTDKPQAMKTVQGREVYGRTLPGGTWQKFMNAYLDGTPQDELTDEVEVNPAFRPGPRITAAPPATTSAAPTPTRTRPTPSPTPSPTPTPTPTTTEPTPTPTGTQPPGVPTPTPTRTRPGRPLPPGITP
ncbi:MAG TPA: transglycosylase domain-containing protein [Mycobacteriales bacterium]|nr:transglycosylase domain-containing protein [Mycobacteriales bacterium]